MEVLHEVFALSPEQPIAELEEENHRYYQRQLPNGGHIACFAYIDKEIVGCGRMCLYKEMPSPDNSNGKCANLRNIYARPQFRRNGVGDKIIRWLIAQAEQQEITKIYLEISEDGRLLYQEIGFADMVGYMKWTGGKSDECEGKRH